MANNDFAKAANKSNAPFIKITIVVVLLMAVGLTLYVKENQGPTTALVAAAPEEPPGAGVSPQAAAATVASGIPKLVDLGAGKCIPCKMMAPILEQMKKDFAGHLDVQFIDVWENPDAGKEYGVSIIPTQIFYDATGKERFRHEGFYARGDMLAKWKELGVDLGTTASEFSRLEPAVADSRPKDSVCYLCDGDIDPKTRTIMKTPEGDVGFCSPHCYLITYASLTDEAKSHDGVSVTDWSSGSLVPVMSAIYLYGVDAKGRPTTKAFAGEASAKNEQKVSGGNVLGWTSFQEKELATRCAFCDRPVYPDDACVVRVQGIQTWGCCTMCALGVAARTGNDIEVEAKDALTGERIRVTSYEGHVADLVPSTSVAWAGSRKDADGKIVSTGCFKQAFFANDANLKKWVEDHPAATGRMIPIEQALAEKMKLTPQQIAKACKIGECTPK
jgi:thioredoxin 1